MVRKSENNKNTAPVRKKTEYVCRHRYNMLYGDGRMTRSIDGIRFC